MQAECPFCHTVFRLTATQLEIAEGMVRCGVCHEVFNALEKNAPASAKDSNAKDDQGTKSTAEFSSPTDKLFEEQSKLIPDSFRIPEVHQTRPPLTNIVWALAIMLVSASLVVEYMWFNRNQLLDDHVLKPSVMKMCSFVDCEIMAMRNTDQIEMLTRNIYSHPNVKDALMVSITMINHAEFAQPHPVVQIDFSDVRGKVIAARRFSPDEYFQVAKENLRLLEPKKPVSFGLEIQDPGDQAMTYEFTFL
jgi:predicted Zn finger-like uncharacterized protein